MASRFPTKHTEGLPTEEEIWEQYVKVETSGIVPEGCIEKRSALDRSIEVMVHEARYSEKCIGEWHASFQEDPSYSFEWARSTALHAARLKWKAWTAKRLIETTDISEVLGMVERDLRSKNMSASSSSTDPISNYMDRCHTEVLSDIVEYLKNAEIKHIADVKEMEQ